MSSIDYRKIYFDSTGVEIPKNYEIHHIDFDRSNNTIQNLVALPTDIHRLYHQLEMWYSNYVIKDKLITFTVNSPNQNDINLESLVSYKRCVKVIHKFIVFRDSMVYVNQGNSFGFNYDVNVNELINSINNEI